MFELVDELSAEGIRKRTQKSWALESSGYLPRFLKTIERLYGSGDNTEAVADTIISELWESFHQQKSAIINWLSEQLHILSLTIRNRTHLTCIWICLCGIADSNLKDETSSQMLKSVYQIQAPCNVFSLQYMGKQQKTYFIYYYIWFFGHSKINPLLYNLFL